MIFLSGATPFNPNNLMETAGLVHMSMDVAQGVVSYKPNLSDGPFKTRNLTFQEWWAEVVISSGKGQQPYYSLTRGSLILHVANQDGGGHIDQTLAQEYAEISKKNAVGYVFWTSDSNLEIPIPQLISTSVRQIAHELLESIKLHQASLSPRTSSTGNA